LILLLVSGNLGRRIFIKMNPQELLKNLKQYFAMNLEDMAHNEEQNQGEKDSLYEVQNAVRDSNSFVELYRALSILSNGDDSEIEGLINSFLPTYDVPYSTEQIMQAMKTGTEAFPSPLGIQSKTREDRENLGLSPEPKENQNRRKTEMDRPPVKGIPQVDPNAVMNSKDMSDHILDRYQEYQRTKDPAILEEIKGLSKHVGERLSVHQLDLRLSRRVAAKRMTGKVGHSSLFHTRENRRIAQNAQHPSAQYSYPLQTPATPAQITPPTATGTTPPPIPTSPPPTGKKWVMDPVSNTWVMADASTLTSQ
jgi:hypothetical protein